MQAFLALAQGILGLAAFTDILDAAGKPEQVLAVAHPRGFHRCPHDLAGAMHEPVYRGECGAGGGGRCPGGSDSPPVARVPGVLPAVAEHRRRAQARDAVARVMWMR